jgi:hypothetical protein
VTATDAAGNVSRGSFRVRVADTTAPAGTIVINGDAPATGTPTITVTLSFTDAVGVATMRFSTDGGTTWTAWEPYATSKTLILPTPDGTKTVTAQVADAARNVGTTSDSISLVTTPPQVTITPPATGSCDLCSQYFLRYAIVSPFAIVSSSTTLDGVPIANGGAIDPFYLGAGTHTVRVTATDVYGKTTVQTLVFEVHATIEGLICAVQRGVREGLIARELEQSLLAKLYAARSSRDRGNRTAEVNQLTALVHEVETAQAGKKITATFAVRFVGWTNDLIARINARVVATVVLPTPLTAIKFAPRRPAHLHRGHRLRRTRA